jgi:hypothetical protein
MNKLNRDVLYLISKELQDDEKALYSCLLVNKTWCEIFVPLLWKNPWRYFVIEIKIILPLFNTIISHLSNEARDNLHSFISLESSYKKPLFDYISFCKHLDLIEIRRLINALTNEKCAASVIEDEILKLFINENRVFTHLYMPNEFSNQIHLISRTKRCFSELQFLRCNSNVNDDVIAGLTEICKSIKELKLFIVYGSNYGIIKLIEAQKKLINITLPLRTYEIESFCKILENSLIKHASTIQYCKIARRPSTNFLSSLVNLKELELGCTTQINNSWNCLENLSFPFLKIVRSSSVLK